MGTNSESRYKCEGAEEISVIIGLSVSILLKSDTMSLAQIIPQSLNKSELFNQIIGKFRGFFSHLVCSQPFFNPVNIY